MTTENTSIEIIEKRRYLRLNDNFKVSFQPAGEFGDEIEGQKEDVGYSKNLSLGGISFVTEKGLEVGDYTRATVEIPELAEPIEVVGQVVRSEQLPGGGSEVAIRILPFGIDEDQRSKLELFIYDHFLADPLE